MLTGISSRTDCLDTKLLPALQKISTTVKARLLEEARARAISLPTQCFVDRNKPRSKLLALYAAFHAAATRPTARRTSLSQTRFPTSSHALKERLKITRSHSRYSYIRPAQRRKTFFRLHNNHLIPKLLLFILERFECCSETDSIMCTL